MSPRRTSRAKTRAKDSAPALALSAEQVSDIEQAIRELDGIPGGVRELEDALFSAKQESGRLLRRLRLNLGLSLAAAAKEATRRGVRVTPSNISRLESATDWRPDVRALYVGALRELFATFTGTERAQRRHDATQRT